jgi:hypothetical protein
MGVLGGGRASPSERSWPSAGKFRDGVEYCHHFLIYIPDAGCLDEEVICIIEASLIVEFRIIVAGKHDNRYMLGSRRGLQFPEHRQPVHSRHADVQEDNINLSPKGQPESLSTVLSGYYGVSQRGQTFPEGQADIFVIIDCKYACHSLCVIIALYQCGAKGKKCPSSRLRCGDSWICWFAKM